MDATTWQRAQQIFDQAIQKPADERAALVGEACAGDSALRSEVEKLLRAHETAGDFLASPTVSTPTAPVSPEEREGARIGPYKLLQRIGEGGFATVYMAEQTEPVLRKVALKIIKLGMDTKQVVGRFEAERQALAMMDHPNIAHVFDAGATDSGRPYFVMELVRGVPINEYFDQNNLTLRERRALFMLVCHAVQHAHTKGIIHRDIKPSNVLVTSHDGAPVPKVIDFGIAKAMHVRLTDKTVFTEFRQFIGTPAYVSPEQAEFSGLDIDTRSDVYSLGVLLYELLTGQTPFDSQTLREAPFDELRRIIREVEPPTPSSRVSSLADSSHPSEEPPTSVGAVTPVRGALPVRESARAEARGSSIIDIADHRRTDPESLTRSLRGDLDWIVMKCLEKDRTRRYQSASAFADDVQRYLANQPILARPPSAMYQLRKFAGRNRALVGGAAAVFVVLLAGIIATSWQAVVATRAKEAEAAQRQNAENEKTLAEAVTGLLQEMLSSADPHEVKGRDYTVLQLLDDFDAGLGDELKDHPKVEASVRKIMGNTYRNLGVLDKAERHLRAALDIRRDLFGEQHVLANQSLFDWAGLMHDKGEYAQAEQFFRKTLAIDRKLYGEEHPAPASDLGQIGDMLIHMGRYDQAERVLREALGMGRKRLSDEDLAPILDALGVALEYKADHVGAEQLHREALAIRRKVFGDGHPSVATSLTNLGGPLERMKRYDEAEQAYREALQIGRAALGSEHVEVATYLNNLAVLHWRRGKPSEAEPLLRQALDINRKALGPEHPGTLMILYNLGNQLEAQGKLSEAELLYVQALQARKRLLGEEHLDTLISLATLAGLYANQGEYDKAEPLYLEALEARKGVLGEDHPDTLTTMNKLVLLYAKQRRYDEAVPLAELTLEKTRRVLGEDHRDALADMNVLAGLYVKQRRYDEAEPLRRRVLAIRKRVLGEEHPRVAKDLHHFADGLRLAKKLDEAERLARQALAIYRKTAKTDVREHIHAVRVLVAILEDGGQLDEAVAVSRESIGRWRRLRVADVNQQRHSVLTLVRILREAGKPREAESTLREYLELRRTASRDGSVGMAGVLAVLGEVLLERAEYGDAETAMRECLVIREDKLPDHWLRFNAMSMLGAALAGRGAELGAVAPASAIESFVEAEPLLLKSYQQIEPPPRFVCRKREALERIVKLYEAWDTAEPGKGYDAKSTEWRAKLEETSE